jgi:electron transfer flavoprotein beta subunit
MSDPLHVVVLVKQVPDTYSERRLREDDWTLDRDATDPVIDEIDTRGVEAGLQLVEEHGGEVTVLTMGPERATEALRKALAMGAAKAVHVQDERLAGACALQTSLALAAALRTLSPDVVITGNESTDGRTGSLPSMLAERLGMPQLTSARSLRLDPQSRSLSAERVHDSGVTELAASLPAVVSVNEKANEPRYPNFKGIMSAKKKPVTVLGLDDLDVDPSRFGPGATSTTVVDGAPRPPRAAGEKLTDDGSGNSVAAVLDYLVAGRLL